jgi:uncharacterized membrane protein
MKRIIVAAILFLAFCGLADSAYITQQELAGAPLLCNVANFSGCNVVAESPYSHLFGISLSELGMVFYGLLFFIAAVELALYRPILRRLLQIVATLGVLFSLYFTYLQAFVIHALCMYCLMSALISLLIVLCASALEPFPLQWRSRHRGAETPVRPPFTMPPVS